MNSTMQEGMIGGDSDTLACITGGIAEAYYREIKADWVEKANELLPKEFSVVIARFKDLRCEV